MFYAACKMEVYLFVVTETFDYNLDVLPDSQE